MHDNHVEDPKELAKAVDAGFEHRDLDTSQIGKSMFIFSIFTVLSLAAGLLIMMLMYNVMGYGNPKVLADPAPRRQLPPGPLLQSNVTAKTDIRDLRVAEEKRLAEQGVDSKTGKAHIPIDRAIEIVAREGLPAPQVGGGTQ